MTLNRLYRRVQESVIKDLMNSQSGNMTKGEMKEKLETELVKLFPDNYVKIQVTKIMGDNVLMVRYLSADKDVSLLSPEGTLARNKIMIRISTFDENGNIKGGLLKAEQTNSNYEGSVRMFKDIKGNPKDIIKEILKYFRENKQKLLER
jgi:hypothetical protein